MTLWKDTRQRALQERNPKLLSDLIPFCQFSQTEAYLEEDDIYAHMHYTEKFMGNIAIPAIHGGVISSILETAAVFKALWLTEPHVIPKIVNITVEYIRSGKPVDTFAGCHITRMGKRVLNLRAFAWQEERSKLIAAATVHFILKNEQT